MFAVFEKIDPVPSWRQGVTVGAAADQAGTELLGVPVPSEGDLPPGVGVSREALRLAGFTGAIGQAMPLLGERPMIVFGVGERASLDRDGMRDAAAALARAASAHSRLTVELPPELPAGEAAQAAVEGALLARYSYLPLRTGLPDTPALTALTVLTSPDRLEEARAGAKRGHAYARATGLARDLANCPPSVMTATRMGELAQAIGAEAGLRVEVFDKEALIAMGCGGLLGVNAGSVDPPCMIKLRYEPPGGGNGRLALVGKGIMYDSGGIALKPADAVHATMKNDMSGAGAILAAMSVLSEVDCPAAVTGYLMCTDNMPSGSAMKLGDVLATRGGKTVEVINTDAEGRLVMADALVLATEEPCDAIVDMATLTGACMRALGTDIAGVFGNEQALVEQVKSAAEAVGEPVWQLPMARQYRKELDSDIADIKNMGGANAAAIHAALFLEEFVAGKPWAHIDIAGTAQNESASGWESKGCSGFGARLLVELARNFRPVSS